MAAPHEEPLVLPLGHPMGPFHQHRGAPPSYWVVRLGWDSPLLQDRATADVWALAHGLPDRVHGTPWTRSAVRAAALEAGIADLDERLDGLVARGLVAEVAPGTPAAEQFARTHRVQSLLLGLGAQPDAPGVDGIGLLGRPPLARVRPDTYEFWQWAHLWPTLFEAAAGLAEMAAQAPGAAAEDTDPAAVLDRAFRQLHTLLSGNAVYLDRSLAVADAARTSAGS
ncbi:hypothetical protein [Modestobacter sp. SSW1-42]|uniref:hypothetical protein n=1 Tax=Modestobacter sp. SSW1-42 TaxID=596372 RepID=UPI00398699D4